MLFRIEQLGKEYNKFYEEGMHKPGNHFVPKRIMFYRLVDTFSVRAIVGIFFALIFIFSVIYFLLSNYAPGNGIEAGQSRAEIRYWDALYFSIVTISSLGYGDLQPHGLSRLCVSIQVLLGLIFVGLAVAKLASEGPSALRVVNRKIGGRWVDEVLSNDGQVHYGIITIALSEDRLSLVYGGYNCDRNGKMDGGHFQSRLITYQWPELEFYYHNSPSSAYSSGVLHIMFDGNPPNHYSGEIVDLKIKGNYSGQLKRPLITGHGNNGAFIQFQEKG